MHYLQGLRRLAHYVCRQVALRLQELAMKNRLTRADTFRVADYIRAEYTKSRLNNVQFAAKVNEALPNLPFPISRQVIQEMVNDLGIPQNKPKVSTGAEECTSAMARISALEDQMAKLAKLVAELVR